jgi:hypothetical protein
MSNETTTQETPTEIKLVLKDSSKTLWSATLKYTGNGSAQTARDTEGAEEVLDLDSSSSSDLIQIEEETWDPEFQAIQEEAENASKKRSVSGVLAVTKLAWDILKDSRPVAQTDGAFTSVLASADPNWEHYANAREFESPKLTFKGSQLGVSEFKTKFKVEGTYQASYSGSVKDVPAGQYLPAIFFDFKEVEAETGWSLSGQASTLGPSNVGDADSLDPLVYVSAKIKASGWFKDISKTFNFKITGSQGYVCEA